MKDLIVYIFGESDSLYKISTSTTSNGIFGGIKSFINNCFKPLVIPLLYPLIGSYSNSLGKKAVSDPAPEQGLYDRSDNVNFARKGIPAPTFSLGFTEFGAELNKYYHQPADQVDENFDLEYALVYWKAYILSAQKIADRAERPKWQAGDKYEAVSKELYGTDN